METRNNEHQRHHDESESLFVFRSRLDHLQGDDSHDLAADIEQVNETTFLVIDAEGNRHQLQKKEYLLFQGDVQYALVDIHMDQSSFLLVDSWRYGEDGYEIASYDADAIGEATAHAKRLNATTVHPTLAQTLKRLRQIMEEVRRYRHNMM